MTPLDLQSNCTGASLLNGSCCEECLGLGPDRYNQLYAVFSWTYVIAAPGCVNTRINVKLNLIYCSSFLAGPLSLYLVFCALEMPLLYCQLEFYQTDLETEVCILKEFSFSQWSIKSLDRHQKFFKLFHKNNPILIYFYLLNCKSVCFVHSFLIKVFLQRCYKCKIVTFTTLTIKRLLLNSFLQ